MNLNGTSRKVLVAVIAKIIEEHPIYRKRPACNYDIGDITITKDGSIIYPNGSDILTAESIEAGEQNEATGLTIRLPKNGFTDRAIDNLRKMVDAKAALMRKALGVDRLDIEFIEDTVPFHWWNTLPGPEGVQAYTKVLAALCGMAKDAERVLAKETEVESEKYAFSCFLLRLGFIGTDSKTERKILLRNLSGHSAFRSKAEEKKFKANQKAKRDAAKAAQQTAEGEAAESGDELFA